MEPSLNPSMNLITDDLKLLITDYTETFRTRNGAEFIPSMNLITDDLKLLITDYTETFRTRNGAEFKSFYESDYRQAETVDNRLH